MGKRKVIIKKQVADSIAKISWFIESKGLVRTAEKYSDSIYDFFETMADSKKSFPVCRDIKRAALDYKCISFKKKYTVVFVETSTEIIISEFVPSKIIHW